MRTAARGVSGQKISWCWSVRPMIVVASPTFTSSDLFFSPLFRNDDDIVARFFDSSKIAVGFEDISYSGAFRDNILSLERRSLSDGSCLFLFVGLQFIVSF